MSEIRLHYRDLEKLVRQTFGSAFDFLKAAGVTPGMIPMYEASIVIPECRSFQMTLDRLSQGRPVSRNAAVVMNALVIQGALRPGLYVIDTKIGRPPVAKYVEVLRKSRNPFSQACRRFKDQYADDPEILARLHRVDQHAMACLA